MQALKAEVHDKHLFRKEDFGIMNFIELLANELVDNKRNGELSRPTVFASSTDSSSSSSEESTDYTLGTHVLMTLGHKMDDKGEAVLRKGFKIPRQLRCKECQTKTTFYCSGITCEKNPLCRGDLSQGNGSPCLASHIAKKERFLSTKQTCNVLSSVGTFIALKAKGLHETAVVTDVPESPPTHGQDSSPLASPLVTAVSSSTRSHASQLPNPEVPKRKRKRTQRKRTL
jgi:hypothetical protein